MLNPITSLFLLRCEYITCLSGLTLVFFVGESLLKALKQRAENAHSDLQALLFYAIAQSFVPQDWKPLFFQFWTLLNLSLITLTLA